MIKILTEKGHPNYNPIVCAARLNVCLMNSLGEMPECIENGKKLLYLLTLKQNIRLLRFFIIVSIINNPNLLFPGPEAPEVPEVMQCIKSCFTSVGLGDCDEHQGGELGKEQVEIKHIKH